jgi:hypothetical protein
MLGVRMVERGLSEAMAALEGVMVQSAESAMLSSGIAPRPQVHVFDRTRAQPMRGYVICRFYSRGDDAVSAIANLGVLATALGATDLIVFWEESDLRTSVFGPHPEDGYPVGLVTLQATLSSHRATWRPFVNHVLGYRQDGLPVVRVEWRDSTMQAEGDVPFPIQGLLQRWRSTAGHTKGADELLDMAADEGYEIRLTRG